MPPAFSPPPFLDYPNRRLPPPIALHPLNIPDSVPPYLPSIQPGPPRHDYHPPTSLPRHIAPVEKLLHAHASANSTSSSYTHPRPDPPYSPQQYRPSISPRTEYDARAPRRLTDPRPSYDDHRPAHHPPPPPPPHEQSYALASPAELTQQRSYGPLSPAYTPAYASTSTSFRGSIGSHSQSHRGSVPNSLGPLAYPEPQPTGPPPRQDPRAVPLPGSIPQPVYNDQL